MEREASMFPSVGVERDRGFPFRVSLSFNISQVGPEAPELLTNGLRRGNSTRPWRRCLLLRGHEAG